MLHLRFGLQSFVWADVHGDIAAIDRAPGHGFRDRFAVKQRAYESGAVSIASARGFDVWAVELIHEPNFIAVRSVGSRSAIRDDSNFRSELMHAFGQRSDISG